MPTLQKELRRQLETVVLKAREEAERGAASALESYGVGEAKKPAHLDKSGEDLRKKLRARGRQAGDLRRPDDSQEVGHLVQECAYEHWHRMLFARFLAENGLLIEPESGLDVDLDYCEEQARESKSDKWEVAASFAQRMLTGVFRLDDPVLQLRLPTEFRNRLTALLASLPTEVFTASDSLGWTYQFWQTKRKKEVNESGVKIGADELSPVTQLFTEDYMVDFLLDNTLGAWHAGKVLAANPKLAENARSEDELRQAVAPPGCPWNYLRFVARPSRSGSLPDPVSKPDRDGLATFGLDRASLTITKGENLPHWTCDNAIYHVAFRLADAVPASKREEWLRERESLAEVARKANRELTEDEEDRIRFLYSERIEKFLDSGCGECLLGKPEVAELVSRAILFFEGQRYTLHAWCVMPNHVHVIVEPLPGQELSKIIHSWKSFTAHEINKLLGRAGDVWQHDAYNHIIRTEKEYRFQIAYVWENPDKAGLVNWVARASRSGSSSESFSKPAPVRDGLATVWTPAAGTFAGWPKAAKELKCLDPCMGSGHFMVAMFERLVALRLAEEKLDEAAAVAAVIRDNLFGLEIDPRCTQIGAFNLALAAWRRVGHCKLPAMNLACSGLAPNTREADWLALAGDTDKLKNGMERLYRLFQKAAVLGSLINPSRDRGEGDLLVATFHELQPLLEKALAQEARDDTAHEMAVTARGLAKAAEILAGQFTLVATNVPYLGRGKQDEALMEYCERVHLEAKADLATCFVERCLDFCAPSASIALVTPQNWLFLGTYKKLRQRLLEEIRWSCIARLGSGAFETIGGEIVSVSLISLTRQLPAKGHHFASVVAADEQTPEAKAFAIQCKELVVFDQAAQLSNPDARIVLEIAAQGELLARIADYGKGSTTGDRPRFLRGFWELAKLQFYNKPWLDSPNSCTPWAGREHVTATTLDDPSLTEQFGCRIHGQDVWDRRGVAVNKMQGLHPFLYAGEVFDDNTGIVAPHKAQVVLPLWVFMESGAYAQEIRKIDQKLNVTAATLVKVPFDLAYWQKVAAEKYPHGLPKPFSSDPTQWLFDGRVARPSRSGSENDTGNDPDRDGLATAVARLLGYQWPRQTGSSFPDCPALGPDGLEKHADKDGVVCFNQVRDEPPAATRLRALLSDAYGAEWSHAMERKLIAATGSKADSLEDWLLNDFFTQHCDLFHNRPFVWHLWDGRKDGFNVLVNYHRLGGPNGDGHRTLETLAYAYLGDWITRQKDAVAHGEAGAEDRLAAALELQGELKKIVAGEPPYDLFIRWKPLHEQPIGWQPDINDGVRLNIRPFLSVDLSRGKKGCGLFRSKPGSSLKWDKDRGNEPRRPKEDYPWFWSWDKQTVDFRGNAEFDGNRWNDCHYTNAAKQGARERKAQK